jgi:hypothetical protein
MSTDTVEVLQELLKQAKDNQVIGIAFAAMYRGRQFVVNTTGEARRSPTFTRGMLLALDDELSEAVSPSK